MSEETNKEWVLPAAIPFDDLKGKDLEEVLYWLLDAMGAKDLEWRVGGTGGGAADGGRDLEAVFHVSNGSELVPQTWWIEAKGREKTVEASEVKEAANNAMARKSLDVLVIGTNTQFSNPTIDWVREWQNTHPRPRVLLWDKAQLERMLSRQPDVVLRLFSQSLSLKGRLKALESKFWNKLEYVPQSTLLELWNGKDSLKFDSMSSFALMCNEFVNGSINERPWALELDNESLIEAFQIGLLNTHYLATRASNAGVDQLGFTRALAYLLLRTLEIIPLETISTIIDECVYRGNKDKMPLNVRNYLVGPLIDQALSEIQDICTSDCRRISTIQKTSMAHQKDELENYWMRFEKGSVIEPKEKKSHFLLIESHDAKCNVGYQLNEKVGCPLFRLEPDADNAMEVIAVLKAVAAFRKQEAAVKRESKMAK